jgi:hypothetical protein
MLGRSRSWYDCVAPGGKVDNQREHQGAYKRRILHSPLITSFFYLARGQNRAIRIDEFPKQGFAVL